MHPKPPLRGATSPSKSAVGGQLDLQGGELSLARWRGVVDCIAEAYGYYERRLDDLRKETVDRFVKSLARQGLSTPRAPGRGAGGRRSVQERR